jgi:hypothetical protein
MYWKIMCDSINTYNFYVLMYQLKMNLIQMANPIYSYSP